MYIIMKKIVNSKFVGILKLKILFLNIFFGMNNSFESYRAYRQRRRQIFRLEIKVFFIVHRMFRAVHVFHTS